MGRFYQTVIYLSIPYGNFYAILSQIIKNKSEGREKNYEVRRKGTDMRNYEGWKQFGIIGDISFLENSAMQNDTDLMRKILAAIYDRTDLKSKPVTIEGYDAILVARHVERLYNDGFIDGAVHAAVANPYKLILPRDLTSDGHELLGALENEEVWNQVKSAITLRQLGSMPLRTLAKIADDLLEKYLRAKVGL